jgi:protein O-GlcNAc transferase
MTAAGNVAALVAQGLQAQQAQRYAEAERAYRAALQIDPGHPQALTLLGMLAGMAGHFQFAIDLFLRALPRDPNNVDLHHNLGETYRQLGDTDKALAYFNRALQLRPEHLEAYRSAADAALDAADAAEAAGNGVQAGEFRRMAAKYLMKLGAYENLRRLEGAEASFREAVALDPASADALYSLGSLVLERSRPSEGVALLRRAIALNPKHAEAHTNLGSAYYSLSRWDEMEEAYRAALALDPSARLARQNLASASLGRWLYDDASTPEAIFAAHRSWGEAASAEQAAAPRAPFLNTRETGRRLRVAYVSSDFANHPVASFLLPLLTRHDRDAVEIFCYSELAKPDSTTTRIRELAGGWRDTIPLDDDALRAQFRADRIDIIVDLAGHTARNRLRALAVKAAPVTASWLGYPATTGLASIDWRITDAIADPPGAERFYTEKLLRLEHGFLCYAPMTGDGPAPAPPPGSIRGRVTFGSFNNAAKIAPATVRAWAAILAAMPQARLLLKAAILNDAGMRQSLHDRFAAMGIPPQRIELRGYLPDPAAHLALYAEIDVALDPFPYNGTTTTCEALWMGVPVVTLIGDRHAGRVGLDLLSRIGLDALAAADEEAYVATACALAQDAERLKRLRGELRARMRASPLCDEAGFARAFEDGLRRMWQDWCRQ